MKYPVTRMEDVNKEPRRELTEDEKARPYAKYHYKELGEISAENLEKLNAGPCDPLLAMPAERRSDLLLPDYQSVETGWCLMPDGTGFSATRVFFPGCTPDMLNWWFAWHPLEGLRYDIWCPNCHTDISIDDPHNNKDSTNISIKSRNYGRLHHCVEGFSLDALNNVDIKFYTPAEFGLDPVRTALTPCGAIIGIGCFVPALQMAETFGVETDNPTHLPFNIALHTSRPVDGGMELRSRYWLGKFLKNGEVADAKLPGFDYEAGAWNNCRHSLIEYSNLASFLPELYKEQGGRIN